MRILRNIVLIALPLLIMINLYRYIVSSGSVYIYDYIARRHFEYRGFSYLASQISQFNGLSNTLSTINKVGQCAQSFENSFKNINDIGDFFVAIGKFFEVIGNAFGCLWAIIADLFMDLTWFIGLFVK